MKTNLRNLTFLLILLAHLVHATPSSTATFNQSADTFLQEHVVDGKLDYKKIKTNFSEIDGLYQQLANVSLKGATKNEQIAFYINAYNIIVIRQITSLYPINSALDKKGFFDQTQHKVAGENLTLDQIEKERVIKPYKDARVHFAFSCAALGCPELANFAFTADKLDQQLNERTKKVINDPEFIKVDPKKQSAKLSMLFKWYEKDFTFDHPDVLAFINDYRNKPIPSTFKISHYEYDWRLNNR